MGLDRGHAEFLSAIPSSIYGIIVFLAESFYKNHMFILLAGL